MRPALSDFKVLTFDCYGTLIDWETGIWDAYEELLMSNGRTNLTRQMVLQAHARHEAAQEAARPRSPYPVILTEVHRLVAAEFDLHTESGLDRTFGASVPAWPAFPDTADALRLLKKHYRLVILSNIDRDGFAASSRKLGVEFDAVYTAQDIGSYKPNSDNFKYLLTHLEADLGLGSADVLHTAQSLFHDHVPAQEMGLATAWIDRQRLSEGGDWGATAEVQDRPTTDFVFFNLGEMAAAATTGPVGT